VSETTSAVFAPAALVLTAAQRAAIARHGEETFPDECCGVLLGREENGVRIVVELLPLENGWDPVERRRRFIISSQQVLRAEKTARAKGLDVLGFYHSHPNAPARPSEFDREHAWPWYSYPIVSVVDGSAVELTGWQLLDDRGGYAQISMPAVNGH
jgi:proteasome lid subunit RPN8/RPN11